jgi:hypothetical protein
MNVIWQFPCQKYRIPVYKPYKYGSGQLYSNVTGSPEDQHEHAPQPKQQQDVVRQAGEVAHVQASQVNASLRTYTAWTPHLHHMVTTHAPQGDREDVGHTHTQVVKTCEWWCIDLHIHA